MNYFLPIPVHLPSNQASREERDRAPSQDAQRETVPNPGVPGIPRAELSTCPCLGFHQSLFPKHLTEKSIQA